MLKPLMCISRSLTCRNSVGVTLYCSGLRPLEFIHRQEQKRTMASTDECTAGIIIIGDEIVKGKVQDTNSHYLAQKLYSLGVDVRKISVIPDRVEDIADEVALFSSKFTHVITAGGVGPTHDDITYQAIARGLGEKLILLPELVKLIKSHFKIQVRGYDPLNLPTFDCDMDTSTFNPALKMALVPISSQLHFQCQLISSPVSH